MYTYQTTNVLSLGAEYDYGSNLRILCLYTCLFTYAQLRTLGLHSTHNYIGTKYILYSCGKDQNVYVSYKEAQAAFFSLACLSC